MSIHLERESTQRDERTQPNTANESPSRRLATSNMREEDSGGGSGASEREGTGTTHEELLDEALGDGLKGHVRREQTHANSCKHPNIPTRCE